MSRGACALALSWFVSAPRLLAAQPAGSPLAQCPAGPLTLQVLGAGGPFAGGRQASSSYLLWRDGQARVMVDAGGGAFARFGEAGARLADLSLLAISHLHPDHVADLPALLWLSEQLRQQPLAIAGPSGRGAFPAFDDFLRRLFDASGGAYPVLAGTLGAGGQGVRLDSRTLDATVGASSAVVSDTALEVRSLGVPHGDVPSLAYRVRIAGRTMVFGSDQNGSDPEFVRFAADADVLVLHLAIPPGAPERLTRMHAVPEVVGRIAQQARPKRLVLSHVIQVPAGTAVRGAFSGADVQQAVAEVRKSYTGPVEVASDLQCVVVR